MKHNRSFLHFQIFCVAIFFNLQTFSQTITQNQFDDFQIGTLAGWGSGGVNPNPPQNISSGGIGGASDKYMRLISIGSGSGGKIVVFNSLSKWSGNYTAANVQDISMHLKNEGSAPLQMRIALTNGSDWCVSTTPVSVPVSSGWISGTFSLLQANMTVLSGTYAGIMSGVVTIRLLHTTSASFNGTNVTAQLGVDNITTASVPVPVELVSFTAIAGGRGVELVWKTATEVNNHGFEIERRSVGQTFLFDPSSGQAGTLVLRWEKVGFVEGHGTTNAPQSYSFVDANASGTVSYRLKQIDRDGKFEYSKEVEVVISQVPQMFMLMQNYPNPFNPSTTISFTVPTNGRTTLKIFNTLGQEIATLYNTEAEAGTDHHVQFNAVDLAAGLYVARLEHDGRHQLKRMLLLK